MVASSALISGATRGLLNAMDSDSLCTYCYRSKGPFTAEHVLPEALGGKLEPVNPFKLSTVCLRCNGAAGRHIDGPFCRSWLMMHDRTRVERMSTTGAAPL